MRLRVPSHEDMSKQAKDNEESSWLGLGDMTYDDVRKYTSKLTGGSPLAGAAITGGLGALGGWYLAPKITELATRGMNRMIPGQTGYGQNPYRNPEELARSRRNMAILGGLAASSPWWPKLYKDYQEGGLRKMLNMKSASMEKMASEFIDSNFAKDILEQDPHIGREQTMFTKSIFEEAERRSPTGKAKGLLSTSDLVRGAVGAGMGYGAAAAAGPLLGGVFGMPRGTIDTFKRTGGLAGLLKGTGIIT